MSLGFPDQWRFNRYSRWMASAITIEEAPKAPFGMNKFWQILRSYIWWTHERGSVHYDVMVTLILLFVFIAPFKIDFDDKPAERIPHPTGIVAYPDGEHGLVFEVASSAVSSKEPDAVKADLLRAIAPYAGNVEMVRYEAIKDRGKVSLYRVWIHRR